VPIAPRADHRHTSAPSPSAADAGGFGEDGYEGDDGGGSGGGGGGDWGGGWGGGWG